MGLKMRACWRAKQGTTLSTLSPYWGTMHCESPNKSPASVQPAQALSLRSQEIKTDIIKSILEHFIFILVFFSDGPLFLGGRNFPFGPITYAAYFSKNIGFCYSVGVLDPPLFSSLSHSLLLCTYLTSFINFWLLLLLL